MNDKQMDNKVRRDAANVKKDVHTLVGDSTARLNRFEDDVNQAAGKAKEDLTAWVEDGVSQLSQEFEKLSGEARGTMQDAATSVKKDVGQGLSQFNAKAQDVADKVPGGFSDKAAKYPWVTISVALALGFLLGSLRHPSRRPLG